jgi:hypothetical protein
MSKKYVYDDEDEDEDESNIPNLISIGTGLLLGASVLAGSLYGFFIFKLRLI